MEQQEKEVNIIMASQHDRIAKKLAKKFKTPYLREGVDLKPKNKAIEVATTMPDLYQSIGQLNSSRKPVKYMAVPSPLISEAYRLLKGSGIGIMDERGKIRKRGRRKRKR